LLDVKANSLTLIECLETFTLNGAEVDKNVPPFIILDEPKPFFLVEPFYLTFCQSFAPPFPRFDPAGHLSRHHKKTTAFQDTILKLWWLTYLSKYEYQTFPTLPILVFLYNSNPLSVSYNQSGIFV
jgi:hypothetical protein